MNTVATQGRSSVGEEVARLRAELAQEQSRLCALEEDVELKAAQLGYLHSEYFTNVARVEHYYEPKLQPLREATYAAHERQTFIQERISWLEQKLVQQEKRMQTGFFLEVRDMKSAADEWMRRTHQKVLQSYEAIQECPVAELQTLSNYDCPPPAAMSTMHMVMRVRGEADCSWASSQVILSYNYFNSFFTTRSDGMLKTKDLLAEDVMKELESFCEKPEHAPEELYRISTPIGCMGQWLYAVRDHYRVKLITSPVLLTDTTRPNAEKAAMMLERITPRELTAAPPVKLCGTAGEQSGNEAVGSAVLATKGDVEENAAQSEDARMEAELVQKYKNSMSTLLAQTQSAEDNQRLLCDLRHRLQQVKESAREATDQMHAIEEEMCDKIREVQCNYDGTMLHLHDQLENKTTEFIRLVTHEEQNEGC